MSNRNYAILLSLIGLVGILTSVQLTLDKIELSKNPNAILPCNINPLISCGPVINTWQANVFGFPNPILGIFGFALVFGTGLSFLWGKNFTIRFWKVFYVCIALATLFIHWLIIQSIFVIGTLCLYCMITWAAVWPLFYFTIIRKINEKNTNLTKTESFLLNNKTQVFLAWYALIILLILFQFRDFFFS